MGPTNLVLHKPAQTYIPTGSSVVVTFGRNDSGKPLSDVSWDLFDEMIRDSIGDLLQPLAVFGPFDGTGKWHGETEQSRTYTVVTGYPVSIALWEERLASLARSFGQEAIAYTYGPNTLVGGGAA